MTNRLKFYSIQFKNKIKELQNKFSERDYLLGEIHLCLFKAVNINWESPNS